MNSIQAFKDHITLSIHYYVLVVRHSMVLMPRGLLTYLLRNDDDLRSFDSLIDLSLSERREQLWWKEVTSTSRCDRVQAYNQPSVEGWYGCYHDPIICCKGV